MVDAGKLISDTGAQNKARIVRASEALGDGSIAQAAQATDLDIKAAHAADAVRHYGVALQLVELGFHEWVDATSEALMKLGAQVVIDQEVWQEAHDLGMDSEAAARYIRDQSERLKPGVGKTSLLGSIQDQTDGEQ